MTDEVLKMWQHKKDAIDFQPSTADKSTAYCKLCSSLLLELEKEKCNTDLIKILQKRIIAQAKINDLNNAAFMTTSTLDVLSPEVFDTIFGKAENNG